MFVKAGVVNVDVVDCNKLNHVRNIYDIHFIDFEYQDYSKINTYIDSKRNRSFFNSYPLFLMTLSESATSLDYDSARSLDADHIVSGLLSYDQFKSLLMRLLKHKHFYEHVFDSSGNDLDKFALSVSQYKQKIKNPQLLNLSLLSLYKKQMNNAFMSLYQQHDRALIDPVNIIGFSNCCGEPVKSIAALQWLLKKDELPLRVHTRLAEEYEKLNNLEAIFQHRLIAFENNPANQQAFVELVDCLIKQEKLDSFQSVVSNRVKFLSGRLEDYCNLAIDVSEALLSSDMRVTKEQYRLYFEPVLRGIYKRLGTDKRREFNALVKLLNTLHISRVGKVLKARAMALDVYHNDVLRMRKCCIHLQLVSLRVMATFGEMKLCINLVNELNALDVAQKNEELFKWAARPYSQLQRVYLWLKKLSKRGSAIEPVQVKTLDVVVQHYPYSFDINCMVLSSLLRAEVAGKKQAITTIKRLKHSHYIIRHLSIETEVSRGKAYMDALENHPIAKSA